MTPQSIKRRQVLTTAASTALLLARAGAQATSPVPTTSRPQDVRICQLTDLAVVGDAVRFKLLRSNITYALAIRTAQPLEFSLNAGTAETPLYVHAFTLECTHLGCEVRTSSVRFKEDLVLLRIGAETTFECDCHFSRFDGLTGKRLASPALRDLERLTLERRGEELWALG